MTGCAARPACPRARRRRSPSRVSNTRTAGGRGGGGVRVLGVDPGLTRCGVGVVEGVPGRPCTLVVYHVVRTDPADELPTRLLHLDRALTDLVAEHRPEAVAVERVFSQHNVRTVMGTAQASGIAVLAGARAGLPVQTYTPSEVKAAVTGSGQADKRQMTVMVTRLLRLAEPPKPADAADALALAICHVWRGGTRSRLAEATERVRRGGAR
ncbi:crossover junction endodeoxyribonuclease RuvC [Micromonospora fluostatini]|uniref:Crossover junction endodeoxyribonuclease RuvC n=1 Tax=Micromonospora fluostatini TaxID=1629071 RepID=A0ABY2DHI6_9ACTN|nr:crossover junction endodeoxyribonuclease RuvC [Micromonospora fluostatini]